MTTLPTPMTSVPMYALMRYSERVAALFRALARTLGTDIKRV